MSDVNYNYVRGAITSFLINVQKNWQKKCRPIVVETGSSAQQVKERKKYASNSISNLVRILKPIKTHKFISQVINHSFQAIGAIIETETIGKIQFFIPCFPSDPLYEFLNIEGASSIENGKRKQNIVTFTWIDDVINNKYAHSYSETIDFMEMFSKSVNFEYIPNHYVIQENKEKVELVVGIMTDLNQYIPIIPIGITSILDPYKKETIYGYNLLEVDKTVSTSYQIDDVRFNDIRNRRIEYKMYDVFSEIIHRVIKQGVKYKLDELLAKQDTWYNKLINIKSFIKGLIEPTYVRFTTDDTELKTIMEKNVEISACLDCLTNKTGLCKMSSKAMRGKTICQFIIPAKNLINRDIDNTDEYYTRVSDDIIRNRRVGVFMGIQSSTKYSNIELTVNDDELLFSKSVMIKYFIDLKLKQYRMPLNNTYKTGISTDINQDSEDKRIMDLNDFRIRTTRYSIGRVVL